MKARSEMEGSLEAHEARNAELLRDLRARGVAVDERHDAEHHFWAYSRESADFLADALRERGYVGPTVMKVDCDEASRLWSIEAALSRTLTEAASRKVSDELIQLAAEFDAEYDGWGVSL